MTRKQSRMTLVRASINLASPVGERPLLAGEPATVDPSDPEVRAWLDAGILVPVAPPDG